MRLTRENLLLLAAARTRLDPVTTGRVAELLSPQISWDTVLRQAWVHGVTPLLHRQLGAARAAGAAVPESVVRDLESATRHIAAKNLRLASELFAILERLEASGVEVIPFRGPSLTWRAYGDLSLRHFSDLDILIRKRDLPRAAEVLRPLGYRVGDDDWVGAQAAVLRWGHHLSFARTGAAVCEVHWRFSNPLFGHTALDDSVWQDSAWREVAGQRVRALSPAHEFLMLATHASGHGWTHLYWVCDIAELAAASPDLDAGRLLELARSVGCLRHLLLGFHLANTLLQGPLPAELAAEIERDAVVGEAALTARELMEANDVSQRHVKLQLVLRERVRDKVTFALRALFLPTPTDMKAVRLPPALFPLYYPIRPVRILFKYRRRSAA